MNKEEAKVILREGGRITHERWDDGEYMCVTDFWERLIPDIDFYVFHDGYVGTSDAFWKIHNTAVWELGWLLFDELKSKDN